MDALLLRTRDRDSRPADSPQRGIRYWSSVEVPGDVWFVLECGVETLGIEFNVRRYIATDFWEVRELYKKTTFDWASLHVFVRSPTDFPSGHLFQAVAEVTRIDQDDKLLLRTTSGLMLMASGGKVVKAPAVALGRRVFP